MKKLVTATIYNLIIIVGTVYLVGWQSWNPWWFLVSLSLLDDYKHC